MPSPKVPMALLHQLCDILGHDPSEVTRIEIDPVHVTVTYLHPVSWEDAEADEGRDTGDVE